VSTIGCREIVDVPVLLCALALPYMGLSGTWRGPSVLFCWRWQYPFFMNYECLLIQLCIIMQGWSFLIGKQTISHVTASAPLLLQYYSSMEHINVYGVYSRN
jgi:hypothetical protein